MIAPLRYRQTADLDEELQEVIDQFNLLLDSNLAQHLVLEETNEFIVDFQDVFPLLSSRQDIFFAVVENCFHEYSFAVFMDRLQIAIVEPVADKNLLDLHDDKTLVLPLKLFPEDKIAQDLKFVFGVGNSSD